VQPAWQAASSPGWKKSRKEIIVGIREGLSDVHAVVLPGLARLSNKELVFVIAGLDDMDGVSKAIAQQFSSKHLSHTVVAKITCSVLSQPAGSAERLADTVWAVMAEESNRRRTT